MKDEQIRECQEALLGVLRSTTESMFDVATAIRTLTAGHHKEDKEVGQTDTVVRSVIGYLGRLMKEAEDQGHPEIAERVAAARQDLLAVVEKWEENGTDI